MRNPLDKVFSTGIFKYIEEPVICNCNAVFFLNSYSGSKITIYNIKTGRIKYINMKETFCFNAHAYENYVVFEFSKSRRGIGILCVDTFEVRMLDYLAGDVILGGMWENYIILRRGYDLILYDIDKEIEKILVSCHHIMGAPVIGYSNCAWMQVYKDKCCIVLYNIDKGSSLFFAVPGFVNKMYLLESHIVYQSCNNNKCCVYMYNIVNGKLTKCFETGSWIELYVGKGNTLVWTLRKEVQGKYFFDIYLYNIHNGKIEKAITDYESAVIPTVSNGHLLLVSGNLKGDDVHLMEIDI